MATNIVETLKGYISPDLISKVSSQLGESENNIAGTFKQAIPSILGGLLHRSSDPGVLSNITSALKDHDFSNILSNPAGSIAGSAGGGIIEKGRLFLSSIFGDKLSALSATLGESTGVKSSSASSILSMAAPLVLGFLGKKTAEEGVGPSGIAGFLATQKDNIIHAAPAGLAGILGLGSLSSLGSNIISGVQHAAGSVRNAAAEAGSSAGKWRPLLWLIVLAALIIIIWKTCSKKPDQGSPAITDTTAATTKNTDTAAPKTDTASTTNSTLGSLVTVNLPNGTALHVPEMGIEKKLIAFIEDKNKPVDKTTWFSFDRLTFETNSATLKPASQAQLQDIANILKAYPQVELKLGGYTDNTGDAKNNLKLSGDRANSVLNELVKLGVEKNRLSAEGYGQDHPVADNSTEEGRAKNRRIDVRVTKK